jgi:hypothetical protein
MATRSELMTEISSFYEIVGVPFETTSSDEHVPEQINTYSVIVYETGLSEKSKRPVLRSKYINFIVHNEYQPTEAAYYADEELTNDVNKDVTSDDSLESIHKLYMSESIRGRVQAAVAKAASAVLLENNPRATMLDDTAAGSSTMRVNEPLLFWQGKEVLVRSSASNKEKAIISAIDAVTGYITFEENLVNSYTTAGVTRVIFVDNVERRQWAVNALLAPERYTASMASLASLDATVQAAGGLVADSVIENVVTSYVSTIASASYL